MAFKDYIPGIGSKSPMVYVGGALTLCFGVAALGKAALDPTGLSLGTFAKAVGTNTIDVVSGLFGAYAGGAEYLMDKWS